jgi:hypothetical protein
MTLAEHPPAKANGHGLAWRDIPHRASEVFDTFARSPRLSIPRPGKPAMHVAIDRVRAKPAVSPNISMTIGMTAIGLGVVGLLFPRQVARGLGLDASNTAVRSLFGAREIVTGYALAGDPTKAGVLWARVGGDVFDIAVLKGLDTPANRKRGNARAVLGFVVAVTALDILTAVRMSTVRRTCDEGIPK